MNKIISDRNTKKLSGIQYILRKKSKKNNWDTDNPNSIVHKLEFNQQER